jgi:hypothetical protein
MSQQGHLPIVFIHSGNHHYLPLSIFQAKHTNPESDIWLLGDIYNRHFSIWIKHDYLHRYFQKAGELAKVFVNYSSNPHDFELICLQRWLALLEFMEQKGIEQCLYIDSDVLLYDDINRFAQKVAPYGMTVAGISGHTNFIMKKEVLAAFVALIIQTYTRDDAQEWLKKKYADFRRYNQLGGISDMTFFTEFRKIHPQLVYDAWQPIDGIACDITINYHQGFAHESNGNKQVQWIDQQPYVVNTEGKKIRFLSLHFQGNSKQFMKSMVTANQKSLKLIYRLNGWHVLGTKIWKKMFSK